MLASYTKFYIAVFAVMMIGACSTSTSKYDNKPIDNPFGESGWKDAEGANNNITLRSRNGDQTVEVDVPGRYNSDLILPNGREAKTAAKTQRSANGLDYTYEDQKPTMADREIVSTFGAGTVQDEVRKREVEQSLGLQESEELPTMDQSYLAKVDMLKQLYRNGRNEAALIEIDHMIKDYPTNAKLFEMRGTVLDRMGYRDLALRSWKQSLEFNPNQAALKKITDKRDAQRSVASEKEKTENK